jgi:hypothetical protein
MTVYRNGNIGIGTTNPAEIVHVRTNDETVFRMDSYTNTTNFSPTVKFYRARGTSTAPTVVQDNNSLFEFEGRGYDGSSFEVAGQIELNVDGTASNSNMPGRWDIYTTPGGSATPLVRMTIKNNGNVGIGSTTPNSLLEVNGTASAIAFKGSGHLLTNVNANAMNVTVTRRTCMIVIGADNGAVLVDSDIGPQLAQCYIPSAATIVEINTRSDAGTPSVLLQRRRGPGAGSVADIQSAALASASTGKCAMSSTSQTCIDGTTSSATVTLSNTSLNAGDWIEVKSGTAGGTAKRLSIAVVYTID